MLEYIIIKDNNDFIHGQMNKQEKYVLQHDQSAYFI